MRRKVVVSLLLSFLIFVCMSVSVMTINKYYNYGNHYYEQIEKKYGNHYYGQIEKKDGSIIHHYFDIDIDPSLTGYDMHLEMKRIMKEMEKEMNLSDLSIDEGICPDCSLD